MAKIVLPLVSRWRFGKWRHLVVKNFFFADYESLEPPEQLCFYKLCSTMNYKIYNIYKVQICANYYSLRCPEQLCLGIARA